MRKSGKISRAVWKACLAAALTATASGALALYSGGAASNTSPANAPAAKPARTEGDHDAQPPATTSSSIHEVETVVSDSTITTRIKTKLLLSMKDLQSSEGVHVKTKNGVVHVSGMVPDKQQHDIALEAIRSVDGVRSIHDSLKVASR
jgi:hyperosmotically inducible protein